MLFVTIVTRIVATAKVAIQDPNTKHYTISVNLTPDSFEYLAFADKILTQAQFWDKARKPGYPIYLALIFFFFGKSNFLAIFLFNMTLAFVNSVLLWYLLRKYMCFPNIIAYTLGLISLFNLNIIMHETLVLTENYFITFILCFLWSAFHYIKTNSLKSLLISSLLLVILYFIKPAFILWGPAFILFLIFYKLACKNLYKKQLFSMMIVSIIWLFPILSWSTINYYETDIFSFSLETGPTSLIAKIYAYNFIDDIDSNLLGRNASVELEREKTPEGRQESYVFKFRKLIAAMEEDAIESGADTSLKKVYDQKNKIVSTVLKKRWKDYIGYTIAAIPISFNQYFIYFKDGYLSNSIEKSVLWKINHLFFQSLYNNLYLLFSISIIIIITYCYIFQRRLLPYYILSMYIIFYNNIIAVMFTPHYWGRYRIPVEILIFTLIYISIIFLCHLLYKSIFFLINHKKFLLKE